MTGLLERIGKLLQGKKTYVVALLTALGAAAIALGYVIPDWILMALAAAGLGAVRSALQKLQK